MSWLDKTSNKEVLQRVNETKTMFDTVGKRKSVVIIDVRRGRPQEEKNAPIERPDERKVGLCGTQKDSRRQERVAEIENSWKSYTCFSAGYLKKKNIAHHGCRAAADLEEVFLHAMHLFLPVVTSPVQLVHHGLLHRRVRLDGAILPRIIRHLMARRPT